MIPFEDPRLSGRQALVKNFFAYFVDTHARKAIDSMMSDEGDGNTLNKCQGLFLVRKVQVIHPMVLQEKLFWL